MTQQKCRLVVLSLIRARISAALPVFADHHCIINAPVLAVRQNPAGYFEPFQVKIQTAANRSEWVTTRDIFYYFNDNTLTRARSRADRSRTTIGGAK